MTGRSGSSELRLRWNKLALCFAFVSLSLTGCSLPESGFVTRYVMGSRDDGDRHVVQNAVESRSYPDSECRRLAQTRVSDAALSLNFEPSPSDRQKIYDLTYADCIKWRSK